MRLSALAIILVGPCGEAAVEDTDTEAVDSPCEGTQAWYDADGDGWGDELAPGGTCDERGGYAEQPGDCDDIADDVHPGAVDACGDGVDADCDGVDPACGDGPIDDHAWAWSSPDEGSRAGETLAEAGDLDGDGIADIAVGAPSRGVGSVWVLRGLVAGDGSFADAGRLDGDQPEGEFGHAIVATDDLDGDGVADLWVGAPGAVWGGEVPGHGGVWYDVGPFVGARTVGAKSLYLQGFDPLGGLGSALVSVPDFGAAVEPILVFGGGIPRGQETGGIYVLADEEDGRFNQASLLQGDAPASEAGRTLARIPDSDGDGGAELAIGAPGADKVWVLDTAAFATTDLAAEAIPIVGASRLGDALAGADLDGDGVGDLLIGSPSTGTIWALAGPFTAERSTEEAWLTGSGAGDFGRAIAVGDFDGDGASDLAVGGGDAVSLWFAPTAGTLPDADRTWTGEGELGAALLFADRTGDGVDDLFVGAPGAGVGGIVYVLAGEN